jgi:quinol monooxygenase YgiN
MRRNIMSNKKNNNNNFPFANGIKKLKDDFKKMVDEMPDEEFIDMVSFLMHSTDDFEDEWDMDEEWEDEAKKFYNQGNNKSNNFNLIDDDNLPF